MIDFKHVSKAYSNGVNVIEDITFHIDQGEFVFFVGQSGAGKSTIMKLMMREIEPTSGEISVNNYSLVNIKNREVPKLRRTMGVVFQDFRLIPTKTVYENVAFAMRVIGASQRIIRKRVPYVLGLVGLEKYVKSYPPQLSGGEQQRVALARALVNNPKLLIADEPTGNIDPKLSIEVMKLLSEINSLGTTVVVVTHEKMLVDAFNKRVIALNDGCIVNDEIGGYEYERK